MSSLIKRRRVVREYKYYSFLLGLNSSSAIDWTLDDVRLPALNVKHALRMYHVLSSPPKRTNKITFDFSEPPPRVRKVIEFEKYKQPNFLHFQFKKVQEILIH